MLLIRVSSEIWAGRLCRGRERRSPSKSEREPGSAMNNSRSIREIPVLAERQEAFFS